jgi:hypothetical protein
MEVDFTWKFCIFSLITLAPNELRIDAAEVEKDSRKEHCAAASVPLQLNNLNQSGR